MLSDCRGHSSSRGELVASPVNAKPSYRFLSYFIVELHASRGHPSAEDEMRPPLVKAGADLQTHTTGAEETRDQRAPRKPLAVERDNPPRNIVYPPGHVGIRRRSTLWYAH